MSFVARLAESRQQEHRGYLTLSPRVFMRDAQYFWEVGMMFRTCSSFIRISINVLLTVVYK